MARQRITHLVLTPGTDWARAREGLAQRTGPAIAGIEVQLVRVDDVRAVLVATADDADALARVAAIVDPWLAELSLAEPSTTVIGEIAWVLARPDPWAAVDALDPVARCEHFVRRVVATGEVWGLYGKTWARSGAAGGREALPLWPDRELAARCIVGPWRTFVPRAIALAEFRDQWLGGMQEDGIVAVILPTPGDPGVVVEPTVLVETLMAAESG